MFKKAKVVMLPTNQKAIIHWNEDNHFFLSNTPKLINSGFELFITSDEEIKVNDYTIYNEIWICKILKHFGDQVLILKIKDNVQTTVLIPNHKKIIATTDTTLFTEKLTTKIMSIGLEEVRLPQPSQQFIEKYIEEYNRGNVIADVLVEYLEGHIDIHAQTTPLDCKVDYFNEYGQYSGLKVNKKDNTITIKKVKDSWNREEVSHLLNIAMATASAYGEEMNQEIADEWINENL